MNRDEEIEHQAIMRTLLRAAALCDPGSDNRTKLEIAAVARAHGTPVDNEDELLRAAEGLIHVKGE